MSGFIAKDDLLKRIKNEINHPEGWHFLEHSEHALPINDHDEVDLLKSYINGNIEHASRKVDEFISALDDRTGIIVIETNMAIELDGGFHLHFMVKKHDYLSPQMQAGKIVAEHYFSTPGPIGYRYHFSVAEEHEKAGFFTDSHKLRYVRKYV